ncbi:hypothetical protein PR202_ga12726 [Eleusine coracana subsp. coracana]|uniref:Glycosyltransferase n=1 Tax=Eleusine coracana subsp. coracana TaxID=191504 RepID=A0AAV5CCV6_ELECO|nr:hypothetical protein QOZ80_3AG0225100 [Eleusine coracana subsp. coracana]GJM95930.1 hypothetical protein PR202_ga12726 [Eleusine coracana subsp. coracana]
MDAARSSSSPRPLRIVIFPWLAFGHLHPYLELAESLALRGHHVSFISTPRNLARLPPVRHAAAPRVDLVALPLPRVDGLPDGAESTNSVPGDKFHLLFQAFDGMAEPFAEFLGAAYADEKKRPDWIIIDSFHHWAAATAAEHKVPCAMLQATAAVLTMEEQPAAVPRYEWEAKSQVLTNHGAQAMSVTQLDAFTREKCTIAAMRSCVEWEGEAFTLAASILGKPLVPLGLLPPSPDGGRGASRNREHATVQWLDAQPASSVVYVALGSEVPLSAEQVHELALGLELAGTRFLWALRKPSGVTDEDILPPGFKDRTQNQGLVTMSWVPQISILSHAAIGAFLTHCGRNSLIEGLLFGHPLIMLPIIGDQGANARLMEGKKVGLQVPRDDNDGSFDRHGVASTVRAVMLEEQQRGLFLPNARKMQKVVADTELHERYIDEFVEHLRSYTTDGQPRTG